MSDAAGLTARAVVLEAPEQIALADLALVAPGSDDVVVDVAWSGVSAGTERLLYTGTMPPFPGMGYPLVPGYEAVGRVVEAGAQSGFKAGDSVFVPGARCYGDVRGLFGGASSRLVAPADRAVPVDAGFGADATLLALAATAYHAMGGSFGVKPDLIVGHGALGRLLARLVCLSAGEPPVVWETNPLRAGGAEGYTVTTPEADEKRDYKLIYDCSGATGLLDSLIERLAPGGEVVLAGFYADPLSFTFPPAFMREARIRCAAEWKDADLRAVRDLAETGRLSLDGVITHTRPADEAPDAYRAAFFDSDCLKMAIDWGTAA